MNPNGPAPAPCAVSPAQYAYLQRLMHRRTGTVLEPGKEYLVETRLYALAAGEGFGSVAALLDGLQTEEERGALHRKVAEAMLNYETSFFRDLYPFEAMRETLLPELIEKREGARSLNVWCSAVSTGQEAYSVAMLLLEHFPRLKGWNVRLLASDVSEWALERARSGVFSQVEVNRGLPAKFLVKYFQREGGQWRIQEHVRRMVEVQPINLAASWPALEPMDFIFLRNVLLYFSAEARSEVLRKVRRSLRPDGYLFMGGGEASMTSDRSFESVRLAPAGHPTGGRHP
jgi:chemotaxis protein methyltransferase CheR